MQPPTLLRSRAFCNMQTAPYIPVRRYCLQQQHNRGKRARQPTPYRGRSDLAPPHRVFTIRTIQVFQMNASQAHACSRRIAPAAWTFLAAILCLFCQISTSRAVESYVLEGHTSTVFMANLNADASRAVSGSSDQFIRLWDPFRTESIKDEFAHLTAVYTAQYSPDYGCVVTSGWDGLILRWNPDDLTLKDTVVRHQGDVLTVSFSGDGTRVASAGRDTEILITDPNSQTVVQRIAIETSVVQSVAINNNATRVASTTTDGYVQIWDASNGSYLGQVAGNEGGTRWVEFHPDGRLATGGLDYNIILWDLNNFSEVARFTGHEGTVNSVKFSKDGARMVSAAGDATVRVWKVEDQSEIEVLEGHSGSVRYANFGSNSGTVISSGSDFNVIVWYLESAEVEVVGETPGVVDFGDVPRGTQEPATLQLRNIGNGEITISGVEYTENPNDVFAHGFSNPIALQPQEVAQIPLFFTPDVLDEISGTLAVMFEGGLTPLFIETTGKGVLQVGVDEGPLEPQSELTIAPNPADDVIQVGFALREAAEISLRVLDFRGQTAFEIGLGTLEAGEHLHAVETSGLGNGNYMLELRASGYRYHGKLQVKR